MRTSTIVAATAGTIATGLLAYAIYFDYKRQSDPNFRKALKKEGKRLARAVKEESEAQSAQQLEAIKATLAEAQEEGFPTDVEEKEAYFLQHIARGEALVDQGAPLVDCAVHFYKALKVYPQPKDLIHIYDSAVPKDVLEVLAEMVARDNSLNIGGSFTKGSADDPAAGPSVE
ncbi:hypothetical protein KEM54_006890 [Ascosphaera aggregata]|nr:hypothetical protein KEM54_006890 [Ascosphaera aggregata]